MKSRSTWPFAIASCVALLAWASPAWAGPWTRSRGDYYVKLSELVFSSDTFVSSTGERVAGTDYLALTTAAYFEVGIGERLQLQGFLPWAFTRNAFEAIDTRYANVGLGDALLGLQWTPVELALPWALRLEAKVPLYDVAAVEGPEAAMFPALGDGQVDATLWASIGGSLWPRPIYFLAEAGWRHRTQAFYGEGSGAQFLDGVAFRAQAGYTWRERVLVAANLNGIYTPGEDAITQSFVTVGPALGVSLGRGWMIEGTVDPMIWSRNNSPGTTWSLGISKKRQ